MSPEERPLFDEIWDYDDPATTETRFLAKLAEAETSDVSYHAQLLTQIARTYGLRAQFDVAHRWLDQAEAMLTPTLTTAKIRTLLERGRTLNSAGDKLAACNLFEEAFTLAQETGEDFYAVDAAHMLGIAESTAEKRLHWNEKAMVMAEATPNHRTQQWLGSLYNNIGWIYHDGAEYDKALTIFKKTQQWYEAEAEPRPTHIQIARWAVARTLRSLGDVEAALRMQQALLTLTEGEDGYIYEEIGECLLLLERAEEARSYFGKAYALLSQDVWLVRNESARLERLNTLWQNA